MLIRFIIVIILLLYLLNIKVDGIPTQKKNNKKKVKFNDIRLQRYIDSDGKTIDSKGKLTDGAEWLDFYE